MKSKSSKAFVHFCRLLQVPANQRAEHLIDPQPPVEFKFIHRKILEFMGGVNPWHPGFSKIAMKHLSDLGNP